MSETAPRGDTKPKSRARANLFGGRVAQSPTEALHPEAAPPPPKKDKRRTSTLGVISGFLTFLLVLAALGGLGVVFLNRSIRDPGPLAADKVVVIATGLDADEIGGQLAEQGVIDSRLMFNLTLLVEGTRGKLKAGEYLFKQNASLQEAIDTVVSGRAILHSITFPEGLTSQQIVEKLRQDEILVGDVKEIPREGALLPETYKFQRGQSRDSLLQKMAHDEKVALEEIWRRRSADLPLHSPYELLTLASIVEKETGKADERPHVASVFLNRLRKHMRLQSDPTIVYGLVGGQGTLGRAITRSDIDSPSGYNTYLIEGLPPGPIANPGRAALEAVANPSRTSDLYFVADGAGGHVFADTLDAHNKNVQKWRQIEQNRGKAMHDERGELLPNTEFGQMPTDVEFASHHAEAPAAAPGKIAGVKLDTSIVARVAPILPGAPPPMLKLANVLPLARGVAPTSVASDDPLADVQLGGATKAENDLDGPTPEMASMPVSPKLQADMRARAARYGGSALDGPAPPVDNAAMSYAAPTANQAPNGKPRILDASEGTALDPLLDKSWDLNSPKKVDLTMPKPAP